MDRQMHVMLDPSTDQVLEQCSGPTSDGRFPVSDKPPYVCAGLHLIGVGGPSGHEISLTVTTMEPGRCPLTVAKDRLDVPSTPGSMDPEQPDGV
jgi:hypothetical protein